MILEQKSRFFFCISLLLVSSIVIAQTKDFRKVEGIVKDENKSSVVSSLCYLAENSQIGAITDSLGYFSLDCPNIFLDDTLEVSCLGYLVVP